MKTIVQLSVLTILFVSISIRSFSQVQAPTIEWQTYLGGNYIEEGNSIQPTVEIAANGQTIYGYIVAGYTGSWDLLGGGTLHTIHPPNTPTATDFGIVKLKANGSIEWKSELGGSIDDKAYSIQQTRDGGYIIAGESNSTDYDALFNPFGNLNHGIYDFWVVKLTSLGAVVWQTSLGGSGIDRAYSIQQTADNGYIVAGSSNSTNGNLLLNKVPSRSTQPPNGSSDAWVVKLTSAGIVDWQTSLGGSNEDEARSISQTSDGYLISGITNSSDKDLLYNPVNLHHSVGHSDAWVVKLNVSGEIVWQTSLGGSKADGASSSFQASDGGYIISGFSYSNDGDLVDHPVNLHHNLLDYSDCWIVKLNSSGTLVWQTSLGGSADDRATSCSQTSDGGIIIAGYSQSNDGDVSGNHPFPPQSLTPSIDYWIVRLNSLGVILWNTSLGAENREWAHSIQQTFDCGYIIVGTAESYNSMSSDYCVVKLRPDPALIPTASIISAGGATTFCTGGNVILSGNIGGTWSTGEATTSITVNASGDYFVTNTNACGTVISNHIIVTVNPLPTASMISAGWATTFCLGGNVVLSGNTTGGIWSVSGSNSSTLTATTTGDYFVTTTNSCGSAISNHINVIVNPLPTVVIIRTIPDMQPICGGQEKELIATATGNVNYSWNTGETTQKITVHPLGTTSYTVTVTNIFGCTATAASTVTVNQLPTLIITTDPSPPKYCEGIGRILPFKGVSLIASGASTYSWYPTTDLVCLTPACDNASASPWSTTPYTVTGTDVQGCTSSTSVTVYVCPIPCSPTIKQVGNTLECLFVPDRFCPVTFQWYLNGKVLGRYLFPYYQNGRSQTLRIFPLRTIPYVTSNGMTMIEEYGTYSVEITNCCGCSANSSALIPQGTDNFHRLPDWPYKVHLNYIFEKYNPHLPVDSNLHKKAEILFTNLSKEEQDLFVMINIYESSMMFNDKSASMKIQKNALKFFEKSYRYHHLQMVEAKAKLQ